MKLSIVSLFPHLYEPFLATSLVRRAQEAGIVNVQIESLFAFCAPKERADGPTFGHGAGMVLRPEVMERAIESQEKLYGKAYKIFFSPQGTLLDQQLLEHIKNTSSAYKQLLLLPARYEGMDARIEEEYADIVISLGDFVLMGGDLPAMVFLEGFLRLLAGVVGKEESVRRESFAGPFVDYPEYTAPVVWKGREVPEVVRSGNHKQLDDWRRKKAAETTVFHHFSWLRSHVSAKDDVALAASHIPPHYAALLHTEVILPDNTSGSLGARVGTTSVTSLDIHDIARSAKTYGLQHYFLVTPLEDQQKIVQQLLTFWQTGVGVTYNPQRHEALNEVDVVSSLADVINFIEQKEGKKPLLIATSARAEDVQNPDKIISYYDQERVWYDKRPVLFIFGTGQGLSQTVIDQADYLLLPIKGFSFFNHLSVRSAAAIIFDRWLGINLKKYVTLSS
jgi:tRNA (guanine37-N1)-methyltransferase